MSDIDTSRKEQLRQKVEEERQRALQEEIERIQKEVEPQANEAARRRLTEEDQARQNEYQAALSERHVAEESLRMRELDTIERLKTLKRKKEELNKQKLDEDRIRAEAQRRIDEETKSKEEEERKKKEEKRQRIQAIYERAVSAFNDKEFDKAERFLTDLFVHDSSHAEALALQQKIRGAREVETKVEVEPSKEEVPADVKVSRPKKEFPVKIVVMAVIAIVVVVGGYFVFTLVRGVVLRGDVHVAVLPLTGTSEEVSAIGAGFAEEIVEKLQYVDALTVMGFSSSLHVSKRFADPLIASVRLGYPYVVRGTISQSGDLYSIDVKLVDSLGTELWKQTYQKSSNQMCELSGEIGNQIAGYFKAEMKADIASAFRRTSTKDGEAYLTYLKAKELCRRPTESNLRSALQLLRRAQQRDDAFAEVFALSSLTYSMIYDRGIDRTETALQSAEEFTMKATMSGGTLPIVLLAKGRVALLKGRLSDAQEDFDQCLQKAPMQSDALVGKAEILMRTGDYEDAVKMLNDAYDLNPRDGNLLRNLAYAHQLNGSLKEGIQYHELNLSVVADSIDYLVGPIADVIPYDPDVLELYKNRVKNAFDVASKRPGKDFALLYRRARHQQFIVSPDALNALKAVENDLRRELATRPGNVDAMLYLALTMTRSGVFREGNIYVEKVKTINSVSPAVLYKIAEVYSIQNKNEVYGIVKEAVEKDFRLSEICNGDFYNIREHDNYKKAILLPMK